uniref:Phosphatidylinositol transfer protein n=1 Tax=Parascaris univalens TaxID=6257 RepID=A0A915BKB4_PARUN
MQRFSEGYRWECTWRKRFEGMIVKEYRVILPMTVEEYQVGQLWSVAEASKAETGGGEGVEVLRNEPFENFPLLGGRFSQGQYTHKIYHLQSKVPSLIRKIAPKGSLAIHEEAWNAYPYCRTVLTNPDYMKENFFVKIESIHLPDRGTTENAHGLSDEELERRDVVHINIANDNEYLSRADIKPETSPALFVSKRTARGPLKNNWQETVEPVMCAYKLVTVHFKWFGFQKMVEAFTHTQYPRLFSKFHREVFCWIDNWYGLTMADIREIEDKAQRELDEARKNGTVRGMTA